MDSTGDSTLVDVIRLAHWTLVHPLRPVRRKSNGERGGFRLDSGTHDRRRAGHGPFRVSLDRDPQESSRPGRASHRDMKTFYVTLLFVLMALLMGLEIMASRVPAQLLTPAQLRNSAPQPSPVSGG